MGENVEKTFDVEEKITEFCKAIHPANVRATLVEDWYHEPSGHIRNLLVDKILGTESIEQFINAVRENKTFNKFILTPKYEKHEAIPWFKPKIGRTFWNRKKFFETECGVNIGFGVGNSTYYFTIRIEQRG